MGCGEKWATRFITHFGNYLRSQELSNPSNKLKHCSGHSLREALCEAASLGLMPSVAFPLVYLVPRKGMVKLTIGYQGYIEILTRDPEIRSVRCGIVYKGDEWIEEEGSEPRLIHRPAHKTTNEADIIRVYAIVQYKNFSVWKSLERSEIDKRRAVSKSFASNHNNSAWGLWYKEMALKTILRYTIKYIKKGSVYDMLEKAAQIDDKDNDLTLLEEGIDDPKPLIMAKAADFNQLTQGGKKNDEVERMGGTATEAGLSRSDDLPNQSLPQARTNSDSITAIGAGTQKC
jgi:recombination protein RecT